MNEDHLRLCSSAEWGEHVKVDLLPWVLDGVELGEDVLEIGPGPGRTTDLLIPMVRQLTALEVDAELAASLAERLAGTGTAVVHGDADVLPFESDRFDAAVSLTMLHHVTSVERQDELFAEAARVLRPGGVFAGADSCDSAWFREVHTGDVCVPVDPGSLGPRLARVGFIEPLVQVREEQFRFVARVAEPTG